MQVETVEGSNCYSSFYGLDVTRERISSIIQKKQTLLNVWVEVKTADDFILRVFVTSTTVKKRYQNTDNCYAKASQIRMIRRKVQNVLLRIAKENTATKFANEVISENLTKILVKTISRIYPVKVALVTKVKVLKKPKIDSKNLFSTF